MIEVIKPGLETSIQDYPGRHGYLNLGFPWSGPMDSWSLRLANILVGNDAGAAGLECQFIGPSLRFEHDSVIALTGADMQGKLDGEVLPMWESVAVNAGQTLEMAFAKTGSRGYVAVAGGFTNEPYLNSRATFHKAGVGGMGGHAIQAGQSLPVADATGRSGRSVKTSARPPIATDKVWKSRSCADPTTIGSTPQVMSGF